MPARPAPSVFDDPVAPQAPTITAPANGANIKNATAIALSATSPDANLLRVDFVLDPGPGEVVLGSTSSLPYYRQWPVYGVPVGAHTLVARAVRSILHTDSAPITVNIQAAVASSISIKSGVCLCDKQSDNAWNAHPEIRQAILIDQNPRWWQNFVTTTEDVVNPLPGGGQFVPVFAFPTSVNSTTIAEAVANAQGGYIQAFGEFDGRGFSVATTVAAWHTLVTDPAIIAFRAGGGKLISPYTVQDGSGVGSLFRQFLDGVAANGDPDPDEYALDKYGSSVNDAATNAATIMARVNNYHAAWPAKKLWLMEYAMFANFTQADDQLQTEFMALIRAQLDPLSYVTADLWFYGGPKIGVPNAGNARAASLYNDDGTITIAGTAWKALGR